MRALNLNRIPNRNILQEDDLQQTLSVSIKKKKKVTHKKTPAHLHRCRWHLTRQNAQRDTEMG